MENPTTPLIHEDVRRLEFLLGTWAGSGHGDYPTIDPFEYDETVVFGHVGKPMISYAQRTKGVDGPLHSEFGFLRPVGAEGIELTIAQPTGIVEIHTGRQADSKLDLHSHIVGLTPTAVDVRQVRRLIEVDQDRLSYKLYMAASGQPLQLHLSAELRRQS